MMALAASVTSWMMIFRKRQMLNRAENGANAFEEKFWSGTDLTQLYETVSRNNTSDGLERIFESGFKEFSRMREQGRATPGVLVEAAQRGMRIALVRETDRLEHHLSYLATVGSTSPYIGLFGTVWGIMHSFRGLANSTQATLATVAPGISEALIATAMGLFAAIPAVLAFNRFASKVDVLSNRYDTFMDEFSSILYRQAYALRAREKRAG